jgi:Flp pilus assembly pilin Flp
MRKILRNRSKDRKGQGLVEYALIIAGVALIAVVGISMFGHKVADLIGTVAAILPGAHTDDNGPITAGHLIETTTVNGAIAVDVNTIAADTTNDRVTSQLLGTTGATDSPLVQESPTPK